MCGELPFLINETYQLFLIVLHIFSNMQRQNLTVIVIILILMCGVGIVILGINYDSQDEMAAASGEYTLDTNYTSEELQDMYRKYNITENDIKFANNELPNFLEGTILSSDSQVLVTEDGKPPEGMEHGKDYDIIITEAEMISIIEKAETDYISKYGVDPSNPKLDEVNGYLIPSEEVAKLFYSVN